jgi:hypothetical protein
MSCPRKCIGHPPTPVEMNAEILKEKKTPKSLILIPRLLLL